jgi:hypothetical protein
MKKLPILLAIAAMSIFAVSCSTQDPLTQNRLTTVQGLDFREYSTKGFLFSPYEYKVGRYDILGMVNITVYPSIKKSAYNSEMEKTIYVGDTLKMVCGWNWENCYDVEILSDSTLLFEAYQIATEMGANGICDLKVSSEVVSDRGLKHVVLKLSGVAIKRD